MTIYGNFSIQSIHFWDPPLNRVITNRVIKRLKCTLDAGVCVCVCVCVCGGEGSV